jgi:hypothetical protein
MPDSEQRNTYYHYDCNYIAYKLPLLDLRDFKTYDTKLHVIALVRVYFYLSITFIVAENISFILEYYHS